MEPSRAARVPAAASSRWYLSLSRRRLPRTLPALAAPPHLEEPEGPGGPAAGRPAPGPRRPRSRCGCSQLRAQPTCSAWPTAGLCVSQPSSSPCLLPRGHHPGDLATVSGVTPATCVLGPLVTWFCEMCRLVFGSRLLGPCQGSWGGHAAALPVSPPALAASFQMDTRRPQPPGPRGWLRVLIDDDILPLGVRFHLTFIFRVCFCYSASGSVCVSGPICLYCRCFSS